ncbi:MAG: metallophosphoesterase [Clostridia bacterium]|nr:metallophosphoesterase [Clostridia bacterium]
MDNTNGQVNNRIGKHYVIGDLHGMYGTYIDVINSINDEDTLYILGDVIDIGPYGIRILQDIMNRPNVRLILGDHEWKFMKCYEIMKKHNLTVPEFSIYTRMSDFIRKREADLLSEESYMRGMTEISKQIESKGFEKKRIPKSELFQISEWIKGGGLPTLRAFDELEENEQEQLVKYLINSMVIGFVKTEGKKACLVHAAPYDKKFFLFLIDKLESEDSIRYNTLMGLDAKFMESFMEFCTQKSQEQFKRKGKSNPFDEMHTINVTTLYGHTPQAGQATKCERDGSVCLDISYDGAAIYCIEDGLVRYVGRGYDEPTGEISEPREPKMVEDRLQEFIKENEIQANSTEGQTTPSSPSNPEAPGDR